MLHNCASLTEVFALKNELTKKYPEKKVEYLSGGTFLLSSLNKNCSFELISIKEHLSHTITKKSGVLTIGSGATFQEILDSNLVCAFLKSAAFSMNNRNIRNRASIAGNIYANKSCASLLPALLCLDAQLELHDKTLVSIEDYLKNPKGIITAIIVKDNDSALVSYSRWSRVACDLSVITLGVSFELNGKNMKNVKVVMGGMSKHSQRIKEIEALAEGKSPEQMKTSEKEIEALLHPISDARATKEFKKYRAAVMVCNAFVNAKEVNA